MVIVYLILVIRRFRDSFREEFGGIRISLLLFRFRFWLESELGFELGIISAFSSNRTVILLVCLPISLPFLLNTTTLISAEGLTTLPPSSPFLTSTVVTLTPIF